MRIKYLLPVLTLHFMIFSMEEIIKDQIIVKKEILNLVDQANALAKDIRQLNQNQRSIANVLATLSPEERQRFIDKALLIGAQNKQLFGTYKDQYPIHSYSSHVDTIINQITNWTIYKL